MRLLANWPDDRGTSRVLRLVETSRIALGMSDPIRLRRNVATRSWRRRLTRCTRGDGDRAMLRARASQGPLFRALELSGFWRGTCSCQSFPSADPSANGASQIACPAARLMRHDGKHPAIVMKCWAWYSADGDIGHRRMAGPLREELGPTCAPHDVAWPRAHHRAASANCIGSLQHAASAVVPCQHRRVDQSPRTPGSSSIGVVTCRRLVA